ncbi:MAG: hypothetical protein R2860_11850 [Desulfobacterales bacterium]
MDYQTIDAGLAYRFAEGHRVGLMVKNIADIHATETAPRGKDEDSGFSLPLSVTFGYSVPKNGFRLALDNELIYGHYGGQESKKATFWFLRAGMEKQFTERFAGRCGVTIPVVAKTDTLGDIFSDLPFPKWAGPLDFQRHLNASGWIYPCSGDPRRYGPKIRIRLVGSLILLPAL